MKKNNNEANVFENITLKEPETEIIANLLRVNSLLTMFFYPYFKKHDLSEPQFYALMAIFNNKEHQISMTDLSKRLLVSKANISGIILRLERKNFIVREGNEQDKRLQTIKITKKCEKIILGIIPEYKLKISKVMKCLSVVEKKQLTKMITKLRISLSEQL